MATFKKYVKQIKFATTAEIANNHEKCTRPPKGTNCNEDQAQETHNSVNRRCPIFRTQQELIAIKTTKK